MYLRIGCVVRPCLNMKYINEGENVTPLTMTSLANTRYRETINTEHESLKHGIRSHTQDGGTRLSIVYGERCAVRMAQGVSLR